jgi:hypothetical protein
VQTARCRHAINAAAIPGRNDRPHSTGHARWRREGRASRCAPGDRSSAVSSRLTRSPPPSGECRITPGTFSGLLSRLSSDAWPAGAVQASPCRIPVCAKAHFFQNVMPPQRRHARFLQLAWNSVIRYPTAGWQKLAVGSARQSMLKGCGCFCANQPSPALCLQLEAGSS